jgi:hypothetical protein
LPALGGTAMEYKAVQFEIIQTTNPYCWKWVVFLDATKTPTGIALTRADAVLDAEFAIEEALESGRQDTSASELSTDLTRTSS